MYMIGLAVLKMFLFLTIVFFHCGRVFPLALYEIQHSFDNAVHSIKSFRCSVASAAYISGARFICSTIMEWQPYGSYLCTIANGTADNYCVAFSIPDQQGVREL